MARVRADKLREANAGHDGTWVAHPGLAPTAMEAFNSVMRGPNQLGVARAEVHVTAADLLQLPPARSPRTDCAPASASGSSISRPGCAAMAACRCTT